MKSSGLPWRPNPDFISAIDRARSNRPIRKFSEQLKRIFQRAMRKKPSTAGFIMKRWVIDRARSNRPIRKFSEQLKRIFQRGMRKKPSTVDCREVFPPRKRKANTRLISAGISRNLFVLSLCPFPRCARTQTQTQTQTRVTESWELRVEIRIRLQAS
jgi:hypothetical protein